LVGYVPRPAWADEKYDNPQVNTSILHTTSITWNYCSLAQQNTVNTAIANAKTQITNVRTYLSRYCDSNYVTIFGRHLGTTRWSKVSTTYTNMNTRINSNFQIHCQPSSCGDPPCYAYVYQTDSTYRIHLCGKFWAAPASSGVDTQFGVLVHELSHFSTVGYTEDYQYGRTGCVNLAVSNPDLAVSNADNYEYFAEDHPVC